MNKIIENLWLGNETDCKRAQDFKVIINVFKNSKLIEENKKKFYFKIALPDSNKTKYVFLQRYTYSLLKWSLDNNYKTLICCNTGRSRSANIVILYLMIKKNWNYDSAFNFVYSIRKIYREIWEKSTIINFNLLNFVDHKTKGLTIGSQS
jgi:protein-tyrosine phosphatase